LQTNTYQKISLLLKKVTDISAKDNSGKTAIDYLIENDYLGRNSSSRDETISKVIENHVSKLKITTEDKNRLLMTAKNKKLRKTIKILQKIETQDKTNYTVDQDQPITNSKK
jgi:bisphosphoglycerate-dependent phosphoglycerate mutase